MTEIILHHYPLSTFSEKVRLAFGLKRLSYKQVITPVMMPKPDLVPLTGGYRRAPVMQVGADIYCDTHLILRKLEELHPEPTLFPGHCEGEAAAISWWAERYVFMPALGFIANVNSALYPPDFVAERNAFGFMLGKDDVAPLFARYVQQFTAHCTWLKSFLADGRPYLLGGKVSAADLAAYPSIWFLRKWGGAETERWLSVKPLLPWVERVAALTYGNPTEISGDEALGIARTSKPSSCSLPVDGDASGLKGGSKVIVTPDDTGRDPVEGILVGADEREIVVSRTDSQVGTVHVHFPRAGYDVVAK
jgi:glutathione S-transferase